MELKDTSKEGIGKFVAELIKKYGKDIVFAIVAEIFKHAWAKDPEEKATVVCPPGSHKDGNGNCVPNDPLPPDPTHP